MFPIQQIKSVLSNDNILSLHKVFTVISYILYNLVILY